VSSQSKDKQFIWIATFVLIVAAAFRLTSLTSLPPGLSQDEVLNADIVKFILGGQHALFFPYGYGHEPLYHYLSAPFQVLLGDNALAIRLPSAFLGVIAIALTMRWARRDFGALAAIIAGIGLAVSWWPIIFSRLGIRPMLEVVLLVAAVWAWPVRPWLGGILLGFSIYSYTAARYIFLLPLGLLIYLLLFHRVGQSLSATQPIISVAFFIPLALTLQAEPDLQQRVEQLSGPLEALGQGDLQPVLSTAVETLGVFSFNGDPRWTYSLPGRVLFDPLTAVLFYLGMAIALWRWRRPVYALLLIWFVLALLPSALTPDAPSTIRLIGLLPLVYLMPGVSISALYESWRARRGSFPALGSPTVIAGLVLLLGIIGLNSWRTIEDGFVDWTRASETRLKYQSVLRDMARYWQEEGEPALVVADSFFEPIDADSLRRTLAQDPQARWVQSGPEVAGAIVVPNESGAAALFVPEYAPPPSSLLEAAGIEQAPSFRSSQRPSFAVYDLSDATVDPENALSVTLDEKITLSASGRLRPLCLMTWLFSCTS